MAEIRASRARDARSVPRTPRQEGRNTWVAYFVLRSCLTMRPFFQVGYDQLEAEEKRLGGPDSLPGAVPDDTPEMSGHVDALELSATISTPASGHAEPNGKQADEQPKGFARSKKAETAELSESTIGVRGLNSDVKVRSKIRKPAPQRPLEMATTAPVMPVLMSAEPEPNPNVMQLWMDRDRRAAAIAFGFSEGGPLQSHKLEHATPRPPVAAPIVAPTAALLPSSARPAPLVELGRSPSPVRGKPAHAGFVSSAVSIPAGGISPAHEDRGLLSAMAQESVASAQRHAAARGQPALSPALSPVKHGLARAGSGAGLSSVKGSAKLTWDSLEEMSFEDLLSLDARSAFSQLPPLPDRGSSHPSTRDPDTARELAARANASRPSGVERPPQQADRAGQRAGRAAPERAPPQPNPPPKKREVHPPPAPAQATPRRNTGQPPAQPTSAPTPTKRAPTGKAEPVVPAATTSRRAAASKEPSAPRTETEPALHSAPAARSKSTQDVRRTEVAAQGRGRGEAVEPAAPPNPPNKSSRSAPVQRPSAPKKAPPQQRAEELPQPREVQERSRRGKPAEQKTAPSASAPGPVIVPPKVQAPYGFEHGYMMPPMNYGMLGSPFGPPPMINPYQMMAPPPAGLAAHFMPMHGPAAVYGMGPGLAQRTWMRGDEVQQKGMRVGGRGKV